MASEPVVDNSWELELKGMMVLVGVKEVLFEPGSGAEDAVDLKLDEESVVKIPLLVLVANGAV